jgi:alpha-galactosidase
MPKITFMGAGSSVFAKNVLGDCMMSLALQNSDIALFDIDPQRLKDSENMLNNINKNNGGHANITAYSDRRKALESANYVVNAIQVGGYEPCTVTDFEIPKKYGLRQTIADTLGIGGIFRGLRTIPVLMDFARDMEDVCPSAMFLNYSNPMAMLTGAMLRATSIKTVGLCHSVQGCARGLLESVGIEYNDKIQWKIAGINHQGWLLEITDQGVDLYPKIKELSLKNGYPEWDKVRHEIMHKFGYYLTESSEHSSEYMPYFIKDKYPELIERFNIPLDEYPRRCITQIQGWKESREDLINNKDIIHERTYEYASYIIEAIETNIPYKIGGNVLNNGLITNLPSDACVEVPCLVDASGVNPCFIGDLPQQCAALTRTNINVQLLTIEAALTGKKEHIYHAAMLDPHTSSELSIDDIISMCDDLIEAHGDWLPKYR